jgi:hypothetical protein
MDFLILIKNGCETLTATVAPSIDALGIHMVIALATTGLHGLRHTFLTRGRGAYGPLHIAVHSGARYHQNDDALRLPSGERCPYPLCPSGCSAKRKASVQRYGAKGSDKSGYTAPEH